MKTIVTTREIEVPAGAIAGVAELLVDNELSHRIIASDTEADIITMEVSYTKEDRQFIHEIDDLVSDYGEENEDEDEEEEEAE